MEIIPIDPKPELYNKNWLVFDSTVFSSIEVADCKNTIEGVCYKNISVEECVEKCAENDNCVHGYHLENKDQTICVPLYTPDFSETREYAYELINIKNYKDLNYNGHAFLNIEKQNFPPENVKTVFYEDDIYLESNGKILSLKSDAKTVFMSNVSTNNLTFTISQVYDNLAYNTLSLTYTDNFLMIVKQNNVTVGISLDKNNLEILSVSNIERIAKKEAFQILPTDYKQTDKRVNYFQKFILKLDNSYLQIKADNLLYLTEDITKAASFSFLPQNPVYKCENNKCVETIMTKDSNNIYRDPQCFNLCGDNIGLPEIVENYEYKVKKVPIAMIMIIVFLVFCVILFFCI
jgi:hypothetical protein